MPATRSKLSYRDLALAACCFGLAVVAGNVLSRWLNSLHPIDHPRWWPLGVFHRREPAFQDLAFALATWIGFEIGRAVQSRRSAIALAVVVVLLSTAIQGLPRGFVQPIAGLAGDGEAIQYFHDRARFAGPVDLFARWNEVQTELLAHSRTHPPGAVLATMLASSPLAIGIAWLVATTAVAAIALRSIARSLELPRASAAPMLFVALPAVQIYFGATIDAWVAALTLAALALLLTRGGILAVIVGGASFAAAASCSFGAWIAAPILVVADVAKHGSVRQSALMFSVCAALLAGLRLLGFDYVASFATAARLENPDGFRGFTDPIGCAATRVEDVSEIAFFLGPALLLVLARFRGPEWRAARWTWIATIVVLLAAFATGAFKTGETARGCLFAAPLLALPALAALPDDRDFDAMLRATLAFGVLLQVFGDWFW